ncbi:hypothetical protein S245_004786 [Arachis hypogaea]|uniref:Secreted protein n=1 Tax=Arachis hypogaea TaxID=3818 RepID=A0A445EEC8_ARAHY|nr:hypothetical protein Ahy_A02g008441 [Arachis hypogaea]
MAMARSLSVFSLRFSLLLPRCLHSTAAPPLPTLILARRHNPAAAALCRSLPPVAARFTAVRCNANRAAENMAYSPLNNSRRVPTSASGRPPTWPRCSQAAITNIG